MFVNENEYALIRALASAKRVVVTYGGDGSAMSKYGRQVAKAPSVEVAEANTVGAGDAFGAALDLALRSGLDYTRALPWRRPWAPMLWAIRPLTRIWLSWPLCGADRCCSDASS
ncbi:PfkB family carbohydrate kinase [Pseudarthrobacter sp. L1SW]|uniref:PfkB family carbohydrate kinase n=1 Tax=Pseudarthrobacter sp. L1SW TaxID=2851598 RepID=UPI001E58A469|nr:PfkB family carbohydrate kinase [Pseudarthrobacter sp. L1SW]